MSAAAIPAAAITAAVADARALLRTTGDAETAVLERAAASAVLLGEAFTGGALLVRAHEDVIPVSGEWRALAAVPVRAILGATALPVAAAPFVLAVGDYGIDIDADARGWVRVSAGGAATRVAVSYTAGLAATWDGLPAPIAQGCAMLVAHLFEDRVGTRAPPAAVAALWRPWRRMALLGPERAT